MAVHPARAGLLLAGTAYAVLHRLGRVSGSTRRERTRALPGDELISRPTVVTNHAATLPAPPEQVWPWLTQLGWHRGGWYTPRWVDRLLFPGNWPSATELDPALLRELAPGDRIPDGPPGTAEFVVEQVQAPHLLVLRSRTHLPPGWAKRFAASLDWVWTFVLTPEGTGTRLLIRNRGWVAPRWLDLGYRAVVVPADHVMARGMLRGLSSRVARARTPGSATASATRPVGRHATGERRGVSSSGMEYAVYGDGPRTMLVLPGGPGSELPSGLLAWLESRTTRAYMDSGYAVWTVTRRRHMAPGTSVADMARDHADFIREQLGGRVDVVLGQSYGGLIALLLAADHPEVVGRVVAAGAAATISDWGREVDLRWAGHRAAGRHTEAGATMLEYVLPGARWSRFRHALGPAVGTMFKSSRVPAEDLLVEAEAERLYDARDALGRITVPVLLVCGGADRFFPPQIVRETADAIADCRTITYPGLGHIRTLAGSRLQRDVLAWLAPAPEPTSRVQGREVPAHLCWCTGRR